MTPIYGHSQDVARFVCALVPECRDGFGNCTAIGVIDRKGRLVAGVVYHNWSPDHGVIEMSSAATTRRWLTRPVLEAIFAYPFEQLGCQMVVARTDEKNAHIRRMWKAIGATEYIIPRLRGRTASEAILTLPDEAWASSNFMRGRDGKAQSPEAA